MKKILSIMVAAGVIAALSISAFASEASPKFNNSPITKAETFVADLGEGLSADTSVADAVLDHGEKEGVVLVEGGEECSTEIGDGLSAEDTVKDVM